MATAEKSKLQRGIAPTPDVDPLFVLAPTEAPVVVRYLASLAMAAVATVVAILVDSQVMIPNLSLVFVLPVIIAAVGFGLGPSLFSATLGAFAYNFFLTEPRYTLRVDDPANIWAIGLLFVVGCIASAIASIARRRALDATMRGRQATVLHGYGRDVVAADNTKAIASTTASALSALFQVPVVVILISEGNGLSVERAGDVELQEAEYEAAQSSSATGTVMRAGVYPNDTSRFDFWPVATAVGQSAVIGLAFDPDERPSAPDILVGIVGSLLALALERQHSRVDLDVRPLG